MQFHGTRCLSKGHWHWTGKSLEKDLLLISNYQCITLVCIHLSEIMMANTFIEVHCMSDTILSSLPHKLSTTLWARYNCYPNVLLKSNVPKVTVSNWQSQDLNTQSDSRVQAPNHCTMPPSCCRIWLLHLRLLVNDFKCVMVWIRATSINDKRQYLIYVLETSGWNLSICLLASRGTDTAEKDIDGFVKVL